MAEDPDSTALLQAWCAELDRLGPERAGDLVEALLAYLQPAAAERQRLAALILTAPT